MRGSRLSIKDVMTLNFDSSNVKVINDSFVTSTQGTTPSHGVRVTIAATHSGLITRNNGFYLPDRMRSGTASWTTHYDKPIQVHHNDHSDPVGRIVSARYVDTTNSVINRFQNSVLRDSAGKQVAIANEQFWKDFTSTKTSFMRKMDMIQIMDSVLNNPEYSGLGYSEITADITDPEAAQKVLNRIYLTGSVGALTDKAVCSECKMDWLEDGICDHKPGNEYNGKKMFIVAGTLEYDEYSFVNQPADRHSGIIEINYGNIKNSVESESRDSSRYQSEIRISDSKLEDGLMTIENQATGVPETQVSTEAPVVEEAASTVADSVSTVDPVVAILDKLLSESPDITSEEAQTLYDSLELETKLDAVSVAKLPKSVFVGPNRTFPVVDEAHYRAIAKFSIKHGDHSLAQTDTAKRFADKLDRKRKAMGYTALSDAEKLSSTGTETHVVDVVVSTEVKIEDNRAASVMHRVLNLMEENDYVPTGTEAPLTEQEMTGLRTLLSRLSKIVGKDQLLDAIVKEGLALDIAVEDSLVSEVEKAELRSAELTDELSLLRRELGSLITDVTNLEDQLIDAKATTRKVKGEHAHVLSVLKNSADKQDLAAFTHLSDEQLDTTLKTLSTEVDIIKIADSLSSGLSKVPSIKVEPPVGETEPPAEQSKPKNTPTTATIEWVDGVYRHLLVKEGDYPKAKTFKDEMIRQGLYPAPKSEIK